MSQPNTPWANSAQGAVSLTFDDGLASQLSVAVPLLNKYNLHGTFYLNPKDGFEQAMLAWRNVAEAGHELGNHTIRHPCSHNFAFVSENNRLALESMTLEQMAQEIIETGRRIQWLAPAQKATSFAYPCYLEYVGHGQHRQSYVPLVAKHCIAGRGRGEHANDPHHCDPASLWSWPCERMSGEELIGLAETAATEGRWGILTFHGIQEGRLTVSDRDLELLCAFLARNRERIWTAPVATVAERLVAWQAVALA